jgi:hypothetical protein
LKHREISSALFAVAGSIEVIKLEGFSLISLGLGVQEMEFVDESLRICTGFMASRVRQLSLSVKVIRREPANRNACTSHEYANEVNPLFVDFV